MFQLEKGQKVWKFGQNFGLNSVFSLLLAVAYFSESRTLTTFFNFSIFFFFQKFPKFKPIFAEKEEAQSISILNDFSLKLSLGIRTIRHWFQWFCDFCKENVPIFHHFLLEYPKNLKNSSAISVFSVANFLREMCQFFAKIPRKPWKFWKKIRFLKKKKGLLFKFCGKIPC